MEIEASVLYGMISGTVGTLIAIWAFYRTLNSDRLYLEIDVGCGESYGWPSYYLSFANKGRNIKIHAISSAMYGPMPEGLFEDMKLDPPRAAQRSTIGEVSYPFILPRNDWREMPPQYFRYDILHKYGKKWAVRIEFDAGRSIEIPNWRLEYGGAITLSTPRWNPNGSPKMNLGSKYLKEHAERLRRLDLKQAADSSQ